MQALRFDRKVQQRLLDELRLFIAINEYSDDLVQLKQRAEEGAALSDEARQLIAHLEQTRNKRARRAGSITELAKRFVEKDEFKDLGLVIKALSQMRPEAKAEVERILATAVTGGAEAGNHPRSLEIYREIAAAGGPTPEICARIAELHGMQPFQVEHLYWEGFSASQQSAERDEATGAPPAEAEPPEPAASAAAPDPEPKKRGAEVQPADPGAPDAPGDTSTEHSQTAPSSGQVHEAGSEKASKPSGSTGSDSADSDQDSKQSIYAGTIVRVLLDRLEVSVPTEPPRMALLGVHRFAGQHRYLPQDIFQPGETIDVVVVAPPRGRQRCQVAPVDPELLNRRIAARDAARSGQMLPAQPDRLAEGQPAEAKGEESGADLVAHAPRPGTRPRAAGGIHPSRYRNPIERLVDRIMDQYGELPNDPVDYSTLGKPHPPVSVDSACDRHGAPEDSVEMLWQDLRGTIRSALVLLEQALGERDLDTAAHLTSNAAFLLRSQAARCIRLLRQTRWLSDDPERGSDRTYPID